MKEFSKNLKTLRAKQGLSQKELANQIGISDKTISKWNARRLPVGKLKTECRMQRY